MTNNKPRVYAEPFQMRRLERELYHILRDQLDRLVPRLSVGEDRATFNPGFSFEGLVANAYRQRSRTKLHSMPSGDTWFCIVMEATGEAWPVSYVLNPGGLVQVTTPNAELNWVHETRGLAQVVIRPLFIDWVLRQGLYREYGEDYAGALADRRGFQLYNDDLAELYSTFGIKPR